MKQYAGNQAVSASSVAASRSQLVKKANLLSSGKEKSAPKKSSNETPPVALNEAGRFEFTVDAEEDTTPDVEKQFVVDEEEENFLTTARKKKQSLSLMIRFLMKMKAKTNLVVKNL